MCQAELMIIKPGFWRLLRVTRSRLSWVQWWLIPSSQPNLILKSRQDLSTKINSVGWRNYFFGFNSFLYNNNNAIYIFFLTMKVIHAVIEALPERSYYVILPFSFWSDFHNYIINLSQVIYISTDLCHKKMT